MMVSIRSPHRSKGRPIVPTYRFYGNMFQSAPLTEARGDGQAGPVPTATVEFQSAPLTEARGDLIVEVVYRSLNGFNPLPSPKQGETSS